MLYCPGKQQDKTHSSNHTPKVNFKTINFLIFAIQTTITLHITSHLSVKLIN